MSQLFITSAIRDIIPIHPEPYPREIINYANSLYTNTKYSLHLQPSEEPGRYHLCCFVVVEHYQQQYSLPDPSISKIPLPNKRVHALLLQFRENFLKMLQSTPRTKRTVDLQLPTPSSTSTSSSLKLSYTSQSESYIDKIRQDKQINIDTAKRSLAAQLASEVDLSVISPPTTPRKLKSPLKTSSPLSPYKSRKKTVITTPLLVSFCNKFYIPQHITAHILRSFKLYQHVVTNSWGLLVGLVGIAYLQLNKHHMRSKLDVKQTLINTLHKLQQGALSISDVKNYILEVTRLISSQKWIKEATYDIESTEVMMDDSDSVSALSSLNSYLDKSVNYVTMKDSENVERWVRRIRKTHRSVVKEQTAV
jgi:origin recognition complex subunit 6